MKYHGSCHCGKVAFDVELQIDSALSCKTCGILPFGEGTDPKGNATVAVNIRCLDNIDLDKIPLTKWDGRSA
jgi:hypothetical protein